MSNLKPTLGHPSREAACVALLDDGLTHAEIGERLGISEGCVKNLVHRAGYRAGIGGVLVGEQNREELNAAAQARGIAPHALASRILAAVLKRDVRGRSLVDAVLDDQRTDQAEAAA